MAKFSVTKARVVDGKAVPYGGVMGEAELRGSVGDEIRKQLDAAPEDDKSGEIEVEGRKYLWSRNPEAS